MLLCTKCETPLDVIIKECVPDQFSVEYSAEAACPKCGKEYLITMAVDEMDEDDDE